MNIIYEVNGKKFKTMDEAEKYEKSLLHKKERMKELEEARQKYFDLLREFNKDYNTFDENNVDKYEYLSMQEIGELLEEMFSV